MFSLKGYSPNIDKIEKGRRKYHKYIQPSKHDSTMYHKLFINNKEQRTVVIPIHNWKEKKKYLLDRTHLDEFTGLYWENKKGFNNMFSKINCDVVFVNRFGEVIDVVRKVKPGYISRYYQDGNKVFVFEQGMLSIMSIQPGDVIKVWKKIKRKKV